MHHDIANFCEELLSVAFRVKIDEHPAPHADGLVLPRYVETAVRRAADLEMSRNFLVQIRTPPSCGTEGRLTLIR
jgi:hypothetical protein